MSTPQLAAFAAALVAELNPKTPAGAHERRFLHMSRDSTGAWVGRFAAGPGQGDVIKAVITAGSAPRPGVGIDRDGVRHDLRDHRDLGQRQIDALTDALTAGAAHTATPAGAGGAARQAAPSRPTPAPTPTPTPGPPGRRPARTTRTSRSSPNSPSAASAARLAASGRRPGSPSTARAARAAAGSRRPGTVSRVSSHPEARTARATGIARVGAACS